MPRRPRDKEVSVLSLRKGLLSSWPFLITRTLPALLLAFWVTNSRPSGATAMDVGLFTWAISESVKPGGTEVALCAGSTSHHNSTTTIAAAMAVITAAHTLKLPALTISLPPKPRRANPCGLQVVGLDLEGRQVAVLRLQAASSR